MVYLFAILIITIITSAALFAGEVLEMVLIARRDTDMRIASITNPARKNGKS
jgi:hypothetical protein